MPNIKDVADYAGVSVATVSRVLAGKGNVSADAKDRVLAAVQELKYRPSRVASSLRKRKTNIIGLLISDIRNPFFTSMVRAVEDIAHHNNMHIFLCNTDEDPEKEIRYLDTLLDENVAGIIFSPTPSKIEHFEHILAHGVPIVFIDRRVKGAEVDTVLSNNEETAELLTDHMIEQGFKRIGAVIGLRQSTTGQERMKGYENSILRHKGKPLAEFVRPNEEDGEAVVTKWLNSANPPDAIFAGNSRLAMGAINAITKAGLRIPDDVGLACFDETTWTPHVAAGITVISQPAYEMGKLAADLLLSRLSFPERATREIILRGSLIKRHSTLGRAQQIME